MMPTIENSTILISSLNWGMGHLSRTIPIISRLLKHNNHIIFCGNTEQIRIVKSYFPEITSELIEDYPFIFSGNRNFGQDLMKQFFPLASFISKEKKLVARLVNLHKTDVVISDHRYGFYSSYVPSIIICHQLNLNLPFYLKLGNRIHRNLLRKFNEIWVPDTSDSQYAGILSVNKHFSNVKYLGILSRFELYPNHEKNIDELIIISGPIEYAEKQFNALKSSLNDRNTVVIVPYKLAAKSKDIRFIDSSDWKNADEMILRAKKIIAKSGYSTLMDIAYLNCAFEISPTKGQYEQEYLDELWNKKTLVTTIF